MSLNRKAKGIASLQEECICSLSHCRGNRFPPYLFHNSFCHHMIARGSVLFRNLGAEAKAWVSLFFTFRWMTCTAGCITYGLPCQNITGRQLFLNTKLSSSCHTHLLKAQLSLNLSSLDNYKCERLSCCCWREFRLLFFLRKCTDRMLLKYVLETDVLLLLQGKYYELYEHKHTWNTCKTLPYNSIAVQSKDVSHNNIACYACNAWKSFTTTWKSNWGKITLVSDPLRNHHISQKT